MDIQFAHSLIEALREDRCIFGYSGFFPDEHSPRLIELGEAVLNGWEGTVPVKGRLGYVMVEAYQNIVRHRARPLSMPDRGEGQSMFLLRCHATGQQVFACNLVTRSQALKLDKDLADLQGRDNTELKELYLEGIQRTSKPGTRGAGLGLIEMVRRTGGGASWTFNPIEDGHDLFAISLDVGATDGADVLQLDGPLHRLVLEHRVLLFHVGIWTTEIEHVLMGLALNEGPAEGGEDLLKRSDRLKRTVEVVRSTLDLAAPVLFVLHGGDRTIFSMGGMIDRRAVGKLLARLSDVEGTLRVEDRPKGEKVLATVDVPW